VNRKKAGSQKDYWERRLGVGIREREKSERTETDPADK